VAAVHRRHARVVALEERPLRRELGAHAVVLGGHREQLRRQRRVSVVGVQHAAQPTPARVALPHGVRRYLAAPGRVGLSVGVHRGGRVDGAGARRVGRTLGYSAYLLVTTEIATRSASSVGRSAARTASSAACRPVRPPRRWPRPPQAAFEPHAPARSAAAAGADAEAALGVLLGFAAQPERRAVAAWRVAAAADGRPVTADA
jgi:hypothetical protein